MNRCSFLLGLYIVDIGWPVPDKMVILTGDCFFSRSLYQRRTGSFSQELSCSGARNKFITGAIPRIFKYLTEHLDLPGHSQSVKDKKERRYFPRKQANTTKKHLSITGK